MRRNGWYGQPYRHAMAARGIPSGRYQRAYHKKKSTYVYDAGFSESNKKTESDKITKENIPDMKPVKKVQPRLTVQKLKQQEALDKTAKELARADQPLSRVLTDVDANRFGAARKVLNDPTLLGITNPVEREQALETIKASLNAKALSLASAGVSIPKGLEDTLDPNFIADVRNVQSAQEKQQKELNEGPLKTLFNEVTPGALGSLAETPIVGLRSAFEAGANPEINQSLLSNIDNEVKRRPGEIDTDLADNPFRTTNVFVGNEEDGQLKVIQEDIPRLSDNFNFAGGSASSGNPVLASARERGVTASDVVDQQVDELHAARNRLSDVDLKAFDKGTDAFKKGDREELIKSINALQREEQTLRDRFTLVNVTGNSIVSRANHDSAFQKSSDNVMFNVMGGGGDRIAEQTKKINEVRQKLLDSNEKAYARRRQLEYRLKRLDASVPPETDVPAEVTRFKRESSFGNVLASTPNVAFDAVRGKQ